jgi:hypothetical protein
LGLDATTAEVRRYLSRRDNLEYAALARLYDITEIDNMPSRTDLRPALLRTFVAERLPDHETAYPEVIMRNFPSHTTGQTSCDTSHEIANRTVLLHVAGLASGTFRDAETALLRRALGLRPEGPSAGIPEALIRNAVALAHTKPRAVKETKPDNAGLQNFAATVRDLAKTLRTDPFAGRVAIAQVYDAGLARHLDFGTLEAFKAKIAEAGRAGLLDLERYDIAGPMDNALRERSRTAFGRDERHFIVNEWI